MKIRSIPDWILSVLLCFIPYLTVFPFLNQTLPGDWKYFDTQSWVVRSLVLGSGLFPIHDPVALGGMDILANPQSRVFSPMGLLDIALPPHLANWLSLLFWAWIGAMGALQLGRLLGLGQLGASALTFTYLNAEYFGAHFLEGHIPYGAMQALPWILVFGLRKKISEGWYPLMGLLALFILDGGFYAFIFGIELYLSILVIRLVAQPNREFLELKQQGLKSLLSTGLGSVLFFSILAGIKLIPLIQLHGGRAPKLDYTQFPFSAWVTSWFDFLRDPYQQVFSGVFHYRLHEYTFYMGPIIFLLLGVGTIYGFFKHESLQSVALKFGLLLAGLFWFWTGGGWLPGGNPWKLLQRIPLLQNAHIQSRIWIIMLMCWAPLVALGAETIVKKAKWVGFLLIGLFLVEQGLARNYPIWVGFTRLAREPLIDLINFQSIRETHHEGFKPEMYREIGQAYRFTYEPAMAPSQVLSNREPNFFGQIRTNIELKDWKLLPGKIQFQGVGTGPYEIEWNTNGLLGWRVVRGNARIVSKGSERLRVQVESATDDVVLRYWPNYLFPALGAYLVGLGLVLGFFLNRNSSGKMARSSNHITVSDIPGAA